jgi:Flp pilus assembly protein TadG
MELSFRIFDNAVKGLRMSNISYPQVNTPFPLRSVRSSGREDGQALMEFAFCLPVLLLVVFAIFTFGIVLNNYLVLTNAVTIGAQQLALERGQSTDPCADTVTAMNTAAPNLKLTQTQNVTFNFVLNGTSYPGTSCTGGPANLIQGASAQVTVTYPCNLTVEGTNYAPNCKLTASTTEFVQ